MLLLGSLALTPYVQATEFDRIQAGSSTVGFIYKQMGVPVEGRLKKFEAQFYFDPAKLAVTKAMFDMNMASIDVGTQEANDEVTKKDWFDIQAFPQAKFVSNDIKALGGNRYEVNGKVTILLAVIISAFYIPESPVHKGLVEGITENLTARSI